MGLFDWLGLGKRRAAPIPTVVLAGTHMGGCKQLIQEIVAGLDRALSISAMLYDTHDGIHAFRVPENVQVLGCVGKNGAFACTCRGEGIDSVRVGIRRMLREHSPELILLQVGRGVSAREVFDDLRALSSSVQVVNVTAVMRAVSALSDLSNEQGDPATHVGAAGYVLLTQAELVPDHLREAIRNRVTALNPKAVVFENVEEARKTVIAALSGLTAAGQ